MSKRVFLSVWITFNKVNEENVYGYAVMIWADNSEVYHHGPQGFYNSSSEGSADGNALWHLVAATVAILILFPALPHMPNTESEHGGVVNEHISKDLSHIAYDSVSCLFTLLPASFAKSSIALGSTNDVPADEINADSAIANMITSYSSI